jgi:hypothetical protein
MTHKPNQELLGRFVTELDLALEEIELARVADQVWAERTPQGLSAARFAFTWSQPAGREHPSFAVTAFAGVSLLPVEQILARAWPDPRGPFAPAVQVELGALHDPPEPLDLQVADGEEASTAEAIVARFREDALPWLDTLRDPARLVEVIQASGLRRKIVLPATLVVLGKPEQAMAVLDTELATLSAEHDRAAPGWPSWASKYRLFSDALRAEAAA